MNRRGFLQSLMIGASALAVDPERLLWMPGKKRIFIPPTSRAIECEGLIDDMIRNMGPAPSIGPALWFMAPVTVEYLRKIYPDATAAALASGRIVVLV